MTSIFIILLTFFTSLVAYEITKTQRVAKGISLRPAVRALLEWIGVFAFFLVVNLTLGATVILLIRSLTPRFLSLYDLDNPLFLVLSAAQSFIFQFGWTRGSYDDR